MTHRACLDEQPASLVATGMGKPEGNEMRYYGASSALGFVPESPSPYWGSVAESLDDKEVTRIHKKAGEI